MYHINVIKKSQMHNGQRLSFFRDIKNTIYFLHEQKADAKKVVMNQWTVGGGL